MNSICLGDIFLPKCDVWKKTSRFLKLDLTPNDFLASARDILAIEKSNAGLESEDLGFFGRGLFLGCD